MVRRLKEAKNDADFTYGPSISDINGHLYSSAEMDAFMKILLKDLFKKWPNLFLPIIKSNEEIKERYQAFRSWRKAPDTRAIEMNFNGKNIDIIN